MNPIYSKPYCFDPLEQKAQHAVVYFLNKVSPQNKKYVSEKLSKISKTAEKTIDFLRKTRQDYLFEDKITDSKSIKLSQGIPI